MKWELDQNPSGNEVYYTAFFLLVILKNSCSKLYCREGSNLILFSHIRYGEYGVYGGGVRGGRAMRTARGEYKALGQLGQDDPASRRRESHL